jgi:hypothetical protein
MKKQIVMLAAIGMIALTSCDSSSNDSKQLEDSLNAVVKGNAGFIDSLNAVNKAEAIVDSIEKACTADTIK